MNVKDFKYREYDIPRTEEINKYMAMPKEERERLMAEIMEKLRKQWAIDDAKQQEEQQTDKK